MNIDLQSLTYAQLRELHYICAGRRSFGFNPALNPATASKDALIAYIVATHGEDKARDSLARLRAGDTIPQTIFRDRNKARDRRIEAMQRELVRRGVLLMTDRDALTWCESERMPDRPDWLNNRESLPLFA